MRSIIFANYHAKETKKLHPTNQIEHSQLRFLGNMTLSLWDCGGQDVFMENYFESQREHIFRNVRVMIYVISLVGGSDNERQRDMQYFHQTMMNLAALSPEAEIYVLLHKLDLIDGANAQESAFAKLSSKLNEKKAQFQTLHMYGTSIWDETLYKAWSEVVYGLIPNRSELDMELKHFREAVQADEVVLFEQSTFLVIGKSTADFHDEEKKILDSHRFEKVSNIIKQFKLSVGKQHASLKNFEVSSSTFSAIIDSFTSSTSIMVVSSDKRINPAAMICNIAAARCRFIALSMTGCGLGMHL